MLPVSLLCYTGAFANDPREALILMRRLISALAMSVAATLCATACSDDNGNAGNANTTGGAAGTGGASGASGEADAAAGAPMLNNLPCDPSKATTCQNEVDCPFVVDGSARKKGQSCGQGECLGSSDENCARDCILAGLDMSSDCATCYADLLNCTIANCLGACLANAASDGCQECLATSGCRPNFDSCSGLPE